MHTLSIVICIHTHDWIYDPHAISVLNYFHVPQLIWLWQAIYKHAKMTHANLLNNWCVKL